MHASLCVGDQIIAMKSATSEMFITFLKLRNGAQAMHVHTYFLCKRIILFKMKKLNQKMALV